MHKIFTIVALFACAGLVTAADNRPFPTTTVTGNARVLYVPDVGFVQVGVSSNGATAAEAWKKNEEIVKKVFAALKEQGVEDKDMKTGSISIQPVYTTPKPGQQPKLLGYNVSYDLNVTVRKLDQMGALLDSMVEAGANRNMNISFGCSKLEELIKQARVKAVADAREKANLYVTGVGARLGDVLSISDTPYALQVRNYPVDAMALKEGKASLPIAAGEQEMTFSITITWEISNQVLEPTTAQAASLVAAK